jgi:hypothetical protein
MHIKSQGDSKDSTNKLKQYPLPRMGVDINRSMIIQKSKRMVVIIPTNIICVRFGLTIPTSSFTFIQLFVNSLKQFDRQS